MQAEAVATGVVYLDTNHLSNMARNPTLVEVEGIKELLVSGRWSLGLSLNHLHELGAPGFLQRPQVGELLDALPVVWCPHTEYLLDRECDRAVAEFLEPGQAPLSPFGASFSAAFTGEAIPEVDIPVSQMLTAFSTHPQLRDQLSEAAKYAVEGDLRWKREAAIVRDPESVIVSRLRRAVHRRWRLEGRVDTAPDPRAVLRTIGVESDMPSLAVYHGLVRSRLQDPGRVTEPNSVIDEWHASIAPYTTVTALDQPTANRYRHSRLPASAKVAGKLSDALRILGSEHDGDN